MRAALAIAAREIRELRLALAGAAIVGLLPLVPLLWPSGPHPVDVEAAILATVIACGLLAAVVGTTIFGGDLADRRLGFYFARPVSGFDVWAGKIVGGMAVVAAGSLLLTLPGALAMGGARGLASEIFTRSVWPGPGDVVLSVAALYCLTIGAGFVLRNRSNLAALDLLACTAAALLSIRILRWFVLSGVIEDAPRAAELGVAIFAAAILMASAAAITRGRVDRRRVHAIFSTVLWSAMAAVLASAATLALWIRSASPSDIETIFAFAPSPKTAWIDVGGRTRNRFGYQAQFLLDTGSGQFLRLGGGLVAAESLTFSADGRHAAWWESESGGQFSGAHLATLDLDRPGHLPHPTKITREGRWPRLVLDGDGSRAAILGNGQISIYDLESERMLASAHLPEPQVDIVRAFFHGSSTFRFVTRPGYFRPVVTETLVEVFDFDLAARRLERRASWPVASMLPFVLVSPSQDRLLVTGMEERSIRLLDINSSTELVRIPSHPRLALYSAKFLNDGRMVVIDGASGSASLRVFSKAGVELPAIALGKWKFFFLGGESAPGILAAALGTSSDEMHAISIDIDRAAIRPIGDHLRPAVAFAQAMAFDMGALPQPESPATRLFETSAGGLVSVDPATGARKVILRGRGR